MKDLLTLLKEKHLVAEKELELLQYNFTGTAKHPFRNQQKNLKGNQHGNRYSDETKQFAMTLHYYSPKAYDFVRKVLMLPHPSSIRGWAASVDCEPGYLMNVIKLLGEVVCQKSWMSEVVLMVDAMTLHKGTVWDPKSKSYIGTVDYGTAIPENEDELATEALVFMVVRMTGHWKHPIAYVLQNKCSAAVQTQLIRDCIGLLHGEGIDVLAVVFDGTFTNQQTAKMLGCKMTVGEMRPWFPHPQKMSSRIYIVFDVCHMLKLMCNLLGDYKVICKQEDGELKQIKWQYIEDLNSIQEELGFALSNKLKKKHIMWTKHKMNVSMAAQTLSGSVAKAIDFLRDDLSMAKFQESEDTCEFIRKVDMAFDLLNSRNPFAKSTKQPVTLEYLPDWAEECEKLATYLFNLRDDKGRLLQNGRCKTPIWGFTFSLLSIKAITEELLTRTHHPYKFVLTYKFSQDHLELLFNKIRR